MNMNEEIDIITDFIQKKYKEANASSVVLGISGGVDSAVVLMLAAKALPKHSIIPVIIPNGKMSEQDMNDAYAVIDAAGVRTQLRIVNIREMVSAFYDAVKSTYVQKQENPVIKGNLAARCRAVVLYTMANMSNGIVLGTTNKTEMEIGYFTKFGDGACDIEPIAHLYKTDVWEIAKVLGVPQSIIDKAPSAGLWEGQTDEKEIGFSYIMLDGILKGGNVEMYETLANRIKRNEHKKHMPPCVEVMR